MASSPITSTMQDDFQLTITAILRHGAAVNGRSECVTWLGDQGRHTGYAEIARNAERLALHYQRESRIVPSVLADSADVSPP
jgi:acyl-CoA synthetase (AMP-forming)/AMP-acid ligase II